MSIAVTCRLPSRGETGPWVGEDSIKCHHGLPFYTRQTFLTPNMMLSFMVCMHVFRIVYAVYEIPTIGEGAHFSCITSAKCLGLLEGSHNLSSSSRSIK